LEKNEARPVKKKRQFVCFCVPSRITIKTPLNVILAMAELPPEMTVAQPDSTEKHPLAHASVKDRSIVN